MLDDTHVSPVVPGIPAPRERACVCVSVCESDTSVEAGHLTILVRGFALGADRVLSGRGVVVLK
jgi:hypothetical protein